jgi:excisionase family DNA binding protein
LDYAVHRRQIPALRQIIQKEARKLTRNKEVRPLQGEVMTVGELAELIELHPTMRSQWPAIYRLLRQGKLPAFRVDSGWRFSREAINRLVGPQFRQ